MSIEMIISKMEIRDGNYCRNDDDIYISPENMILFLEMVEKHDEIQTILITPYLISANSDIIYELHYYEFEIEVMDIPKSYLVEYPEGNILPKEIVENLKPKAFVAKDDKVFYLNTLKKYLIDMKKMIFHDDRKSDKRIEDATLYFQIF